MDKNSKEIKELKKIKEIENYERQYQENDEIDLYDIVDVLLNRKKVILRILILGILLTGMLIGFSRITRKINYTVKFSLNYNHIDYFLSMDSKLFYKKIKPQELFDKDENVEEMFTYESIKNLTEKANFQADNIEQKRIFLKKIFDVDNTKNTKKEPIENLYDVSIKLKKGQDELSKPILDDYLKSLSKYVMENVYSEIDSNYERSIIDKKEKEQRLDELEEKISKLVKEGFISTILVSSAQGRDSALRDFFPNVFAEKEFLLKEYNIVMNKYNDLKYLVDVKPHFNDLNVLRSETSVLENKSISGKLKPKMMLIIGVIGSLVVGITMAFVLEFIENYKKSRRVEF